MILIDTSIWIEFLKAREPFYTAMKETFEPLLPEQDVYSI